FFQAEDGIRDFHVTGVQTCALPILLFIKDDKLKQLPENELEEAIKTGSANDENYILKGDGHPIWVNGESILIEESGKQYIIKIRSEERRVGKECRNR